MENHERVARNDPEVKILDLFHSCDDNDLSCMRENTYVTRIRAFNTHIRHVDYLEGNANVTHIVISDSALSDISGLKGMTQLRHLELYDNLIADISALHGMKSLKHLDLSGNRIGNDGHIGWIEPLKTMTALKLLDISDIPIIDPFVIDALSDITSRLKALFMTECDLNAGMVDTITRGCTRLVELDVGYNPIADIEFVRNLPHLINLSAIECCITDLNPLASNTSIKTVYLDDNPIRDVGCLSTNTALTSINVGRCQIADIRPLVLIQTLTRLMVYGNPIVIGVDELLSNPNIVTLGIDNSVMDVCTLRAYTNANSHNALLRSTTLFDMILRNHQL